MINLHKYVKHEKNHCMIDGLFTNTRDVVHLETFCGTRKGVTKDGVRWTLEMSGARLGAPELKLLQVLISNATTSGRVLEAYELEDDISKRLIESLLMNVHQSCLRVDMTFQQCLEELQKTGSGRSRDQIRTSLEKMAKVVVSLKIGTKYRNSLLLGVEYDDEAETSTICVVLNPLLTSLVDKKTASVLIDLGEVRRLKSETAVLIHQRLCGWLFPGEKNEITIKRVYDFVYWDIDSTGKKIEISEDTKKSRFRGIRRALLKLNELGWKIEETRRGKLTIARPKWRFGKVGRADQEAIESLVLGEQETKDYES